MKFKVIAFFMAAVLLMAAQASSVRAAQPIFKDIEGSFAEESINSLSSKGISNGFGMGAFGPNQSISRVQLSVMVAKNLGIQPASTSNWSFSDIDPNSSDAGYVEALYRMGIIKGAGVEGFRLL